MKVIKGEEKVKDFIINFKKIELRIKLMNLKTCYSLDSLPNS